MITNALRQASLLQSSPLPQNGNCRTVREVNGERDGEEEDAAVGYTFLCLLHGGINERACRVQVQGPKGSGGPKC